GPRTAGPALWPAPRSPASPPPVRRPQIPDNHRRPQDPSPSGVPSRRDPSGPSPSGQMRCRRGTGASPRPALRSESVSSRLTSFPAELPPGRVRQSCQLRDDLEFTRFTARDGPWFGRRRGADATSGAGGPRRQATILLVHAAAWTARLHRSFSSELELHAPQDLEPAVLAVKDGLDVELLPPDVERLVEAFLPPHAHERLRPLCHVPARAHEVDGVP